MICVKCKMKMKTTRMGVIVRTPPDNVCVSGDVKTCFGCGAEVITGFGQSFVSNAPIEKVKPGYMIELDVIE